MYIVYSDSECSVQVVLNKRKSKRSTAPYGKKEFMAQMLSRRQ
jgi:hypothetical protein